jgi:hypothetical protein
MEIPDRLRHWLQFHVTRRNAQRTVTRATVVTDIDQANAARATLIMEAAPAAMEHQREPIG